MNEQKGVEETISITSSWCQGSPIHWFTNSTFTTSISLNPNYIREMSPNYFLKTDCKNESIHSLSNLNNYFEKEMSYEFIIRFFLKKENNFILHLSTQTIIITICLPYCMFFCRAHNFWKFIISVYCRTSNITSAIQLFF